MTLKCEACYRWYSMYQMIAASQNCCKNIGPEDVLPESMSSLPSIAWEARLQEEWFVRSRRTWSTLQTWLATAATFASRLVFELLDYEDSMQGYNEAFRKGNVAWTHR